jgi:hypothetical protein
MSCNGVLLRRRACSTPATVIAEIAGSISASVTAAVATAATLTALAAGAILALAVAVTIPSTAVIRFVIIIQLQILQ